MKIKYEWLEFVDWVENMPDNWVPAALFILVEQSIKRGCFKNEGLLEAIREKILWMEKNKK